MITSRSVSPISRQLCSRRAILAAIALSIGIPLQLSAHAVLLSAVPAAGSILAGPAIAIQLRFNSRIDAKRSRLTLVYPDRQPSGLDIAPQASPDTLNAPVKGLTPGPYKLRWQVLAADGHITRGEVPFSIR